jgi:DNA-binding LacI/PurR family transcriptional regulator
LVAQGPGRHRRIHLPKKPETTSLRMGILTGTPESCREGYMIELQHKLNDAGHTVFFAPKYLFDLKMDVKRVAAMVKQTPADVWLVVAGSREVLEWFINQKMTVFALFGRRRELPIASAGPDKIPAMASVARELIRLGHRRIVMLTRLVRRLPEPGAVEQAFLDELAGHGIQPSSYHLPDWEETIEGFNACLEMLFRFTPPTAMIVDEAPFFVAVQQFLVERAIRVPGDVSLVCTDASPDFEWCRPSVAHIRWDSRPLVRRIVRWAANVSRGRKDLQQTFTAAEFVPGGTIGPAKE